MSGANELAKDVDIDIAGLFAELRKKWWLVLAIPAIVGVALFFVLAGMEPSYRSSARVIIEKRESVFTRRTDGDFTLSGNQFDEQAIGSQVEVLGSDDLALKVITKLRLADHTEFNSSKPSMLGDLLALTGLGDGSRINASPEERVLKEFRERIQVYAVEKSRVIAIEFWAHDPKLAQDVPNAIADEFLVLTKASQLQSTEEATDWLGPEIEELRAKVREAEAKVAEFRARSDILVGNNNALLSTQQLSEVSSELSRVKADRSSAEAKISAIRAALDQGGSLDVIPEVIASALIQRLREREASLQAQISELSTSLLANHPRLKALKSQASDFESQIRTAALNIVTSLENNVDLQRKQESVLLQEVNRLKAESGRVGEAEVELRALEREANAQRELLESYLTQFREAASRQNRDYLPIDARIISRAVMPAESFFPKVIPFALAGAFAAMVLSVVGILAGALLSGKALKAIAGPQDRVPDRVELPLPEIAAMPLPANASGVRRARLPEIDPPSLFPANPGEAMELDDEADGNFAAMAANDPEVFLLAETAAAIEGLGRACIAVISPAGDAGSVVAWELARNLSSGGQSVVALDLTGSAVTSRQMLGSVAVDGLAELLAGSMDLAGVVYQDRASQVHIIPAGQGGVAGDDAIARLQSAVRTLCASYDFVILDCGLTGPEGLENITDAQTVVVVSAEGAVRAELVQTEASLRQAGFDAAVSVRLDNRDIRRRATAAA